MAYNRSYGNDNPPPHDLDRRSSIRTSFNNTPSVRSGPSSAGGSFTSTTPVYADSSTKYSPGSSAYQSLASVGNSGAAPPPLSTSSSSRYSRDAFSLPPASYSARANTLPIRKSVGSSSSTTTQRPPSMMSPLSPSSSRTNNDPSGNTTDRDSLWPLFCSVDRDRTGQLSEESLSRALVNGDYTAFDVHTVKMMIRMFDTDRSGTINFDEFVGLWGFLAAWRGLFDRFDTDRSGNISLDEFTEALIAFGYRLSNGFVESLFNTFARNAGTVGPNSRRKALSFDLFVQACISLKRMTDVFKKFDDNRDGYITLSFEEFLTEILRQR